MLTVKSAGIPIALNVINVQGFIGCGSSRTIAVRNIVPLVHFQEGHQIGEDNTSRLQLPTILPAMNTGNANFVMLIVYGARTPRAIVSGARTTPPY